MTIALAVFLFDLSITFTNGIGIFLTLVGGVSGLIRFSHPIHWVRVGAAARSGQFGQR